MIWSFTCSTDVDFSESVNSNFFTADTRPGPLRRVLSKSALAEFSATLDTDDLSPLPTPTRDRSPTRLRRKISNPALTRDSPTPTPFLPPTPARTRDLSPSPPVCSNCGGQSQKRKGSVVAIDEEKDEEQETGKEKTVSIQTLIQTLRELRENNFSNKSFETSELKDLKSELEMALQALADKEGLPSGIVQQQQQQQPTNRLDQSLTATNTQNTVDAAISSFQKLALPSISTPTSTKQEQVAKKPET
jgi:hypothetical protein